MNVKAKLSYFRLVSFSLFFACITTDLLAQLNDRGIITSKPARLSNLITLLKAEISSSFKAKEVGFCYADHSSPIIMDGKIICTQSKETNSISTIVAQNQFKKGKTYYVRAYSIVGSTVLYGNEETISLEQQKYEIGQRAFGGIIAYIFEPRDKLYVKGEIHGIIAAESDLPGTHAWNTAIEVNMKKSPISLTRQLEEGLGNGATNTRTITSDLRNRLQELSINIPVKAIYPAAAEMCSTLKLNSYDDWFLPSLNEMKIMWFHQTAELNLSKKNVYWTSTSYNPNKAVAFAFKETPLIKEVNQGLKFAVRPMRYF